MQRDQFSTVKTTQQSFTPYQGKSQGFQTVQTQRNEFSKRPNPYLNEESHQLRKNFKAENKFVPVLLQHNPPSDSYTQKQSLQALVYANDLLAAQLQRQYYQNLANQAQSLNFQLALYKAAVDQARLTTSYHEAKKLELSPSSKVIVIDDDAHSDSAETNITDEGFYCSPTIHITQADEVNFEEEQEADEIQTEEEQPLKQEGTQTALIPNLCLNRKNDHSISRKRNVRLVWNPETVDRVKLEYFMEELGKILRRRISNEQTVISILQCFDMDIEKALSTIKRNKAEYQNVFSISLRNTRRTIN